MSPQKNAASNVAKALAVFAIVALLLAMFATVSAMGRPPPTVSFRDFVPAASLFAAFAALFAGAVALDRWAGRKDGTDGSRGFDVAVRPMEDELER